MIKINYKFYCHKKKYITPINQLNATMKAVLQSRKHTTTFEGEIVLRNTLLCIKNLKKCYLAAVYLYEIKNFQKKRSTKLTGQTQLQCTVRSFINSTSNNNLDNFNILWYVLTINLKDHTRMSKAQLFLLKIFNK